MPLIARAHARLAPLVVALTLATPALADPQATRYGPPIYTPDGSVSPWTPEIILDAAGIDASDGGALTRALDRALRALGDAPVPQLPPGQPRVRRHASTGSSPCPTIAHTADEAARRRAAARARLARQRRALAARVTDEDLRLRLLAAGHVRADLARLLTRVRRPPPADEAMRAIDRIVALDRDGALTDPATVQRLRRAGGELPLYFDRARRMHASGRSDATVDEVLRAVMLEEMAAWGGEMVARREAELAGSIEDAGRWLAMAKATRAPAWRVLAIAEVLRTGPLPRDPGQLLRVAAQAPERWRDVLGPVIERAITASPDATLRRLDLRTWRLVAARVAGWPYDRRSPTAGALLEAPAARQSTDADRPLIAALAPWALHTEVGLNHTLAALASGSPAEQMRAAATLDLNGAHGPARPIVETWPADALGRPWGRSDLWPVATRDHGGRWVVAWLDAAGRVRGRWRLGPEFDRPTVSTYGAVARGPDGRHWLHGFGHDRPRPIDEPLFVATAATRAHRPPPSVWVRPPDLGRFMAAHHGCGTSVSLGESDWAQLPPDWIGRALGLHEPVLLGHGLGGDRIVQRQDGTLQRLDAQNVEVWRTPPLPEVESLVAVGPHLAAAGVGLVLVIDPETGHATHHALDASTARSTSRPLTSLACRL